MAGREEVITFVERHMQVLVEARSKHPGVHPVCMKIDSEEADDSNASEASPTVEEAAFGITLLYSMRQWYGEYDTEDHWYNGDETRMQRDIEVMSWMEQSISHCPQCARLWHMEREKYLAKAQAELNLDNEQISNVRRGLSEADRKRITAGLESANRIMKAYPGIKTAKLAQQDPASIVAVMEAVCSTDFLFQPSNMGEPAQCSENPVFNFVFAALQTKKPLRMQGGTVPYATSSLFVSDPCRRAFAGAAFTGFLQEVGDDPLEEHFDNSTWDWAVDKPLADAILLHSPNFRRQAGAMAPVTIEEIANFWTGFEQMWPLINEERMMTKLRAMPCTVYQLALEHLDALSPDAGHIVELIARSVCFFMQTSAKAFWDGLDQMPPPMLSSLMFKCRAFGGYVKHSYSWELEQLNKEAQGLEDMSTSRVTVRLWIYRFMLSVAPERRYDLCDALLGTFFDPFLLPDAKSERNVRVTCLAAGLNALSGALEGFISSETFDTQTSLINVCGLLEQVVKYSPLLRGIYESRDPFPENLNMPNKWARRLILLAVRLDKRATLVEWKALREGRVVQDTVPRNSSALWSTFLELLYPGPLNQNWLPDELLRTLLTLQRVERLLPPRGGQLPPSKIRFNNQWALQVEAIGRLLGRLSDLEGNELSALFENPDCMGSLTIGLVHGEAAIREPASELLKEYTGELQLGEAMNQMLKSQFSLFLTSFTRTMGDLTTGADKEGCSPWTPMIPLIDANTLVLNALCTPSTGYLRSMILSEQQCSEVLAWWKTTWEVIDHQFKHVRSWHESVDKSTMEHFCRCVMEFAEKVLDEDGVLASVAETGELKEGEGLYQVLRRMQPHLFGLGCMLQLQDTYLIQGVFKVLLKALSRLRDNSLDMPKRIYQLIIGMCVKKPVPKNKSLSGRLEYPVRTAMTDTQRAGLLAAIGYGQSTEDSPENKTENAASTSLERTPSPSSDVKGVFSLKQSRLSFDKHDVTTGRHASSQTTEQATKRQAKLPPPAAVKSPAPKADVLATQASLREARKREKEEKTRRDAEAIARAKALRTPKTVAGEGSGLAGLTGVRGKEHVVATPPRDEMMVNSSSESESESDDGLFSSKSKGGILGKKPMTKAGMEAAVRLAAMQPVKKEKLQRSAKDMRARLTPPMDRLHQAILEWDIFHEGADPPNGFACTTVADDYRDPHSYKETFMPLLVNEAWHSFVTAKNETTAQPFGIKVLNRMTIDRFLEVTTHMPLPKTGQNRERQVGEGDIVLFSSAADPINHPEAPHCLARVWKTQIKQGNLEVMYRLNSSKNPVLGLLVPSAEFWILRIGNMATVEREYAALESLQYYDLMDEVLHAQASPKLSFGEEVIQQTQTRYNLNPAQAKAVLNAKANDGFTLVQGPPGTGKTKTIIAMVGSILTPALNGQDPNKNRLAPVARPGVSYTPPAMAKKLLVCAPSNAAVDELVLRLKEGVITSTGALRPVQVLRLGRSEAINQAVRDVTLDELVKQRMEEEANKGSANQKKRDDLHKEAGELKEKLTELRPILAALREANDHTAHYEMQSQWDRFKRRQAQIGAQIDSEKASGNTYAREMEIKRRQVQQEVIDKAHVLCATLSGSGHEMFKNLNVEFETVIMDEAAQCVELAALIPLKYCCTKCILVGDPKQLPPTVLSQSAARFGYDQSLFVRMQKRKADVHLLDHQYRMHPAISQFPSREFYEGQLYDGDDMATLRTKPWHKDRLFAPYCFFDIQGAQANGRGARGQSLVNDGEVRVALHLYSRFRASFLSPSSPHVKIGIITPYKAQLGRLRSAFTQKYGDAIMEDIDFNTTDAFQGRECEIIIFSCVRASPTGGIGFMTDIRRMNVGLTRARSSLWILGDSRALRQGVYWNKLVEDAISRQLYLKGDDARLGGTDKTVHGREDDLWADDTRAGKRPRV